MDDHHRWKHEAEGLQCSYEEKKRPVKDSGRIDWPSDLMS